MSNSATLYRIELVIDSGVPNEVLNVLSFMLTPPKARMEIPITVPNHPFFSTPGWQGLFNDLGGSLKCRPDSNNYVLRVRGETALEEQDVGLFLRWLQPYIRNKGSRPRRLAVVRNKARRQLACLSYFIVNGRIELCYVDQPLFTIYNFHAKRAA